MSLSAPALCYASLTRPDLDQAHVLFDRLRRFHPDWRYVAVVRGAGKTPALEGLEIERGSLPGFMEEACRTAAAPMVIHIDHRAQVDGPLDALLAEDADIVLTARFDQPAQDPQAMIERDLHIARTGVFNTGLMAVRTSGSGPAFAAWWADRASGYAEATVPPAYADQRWCDLAPALFDRVRIVRQLPPGVSLPLDR